MDMMRGACSPKFPKLTPADYDALRAGNLDNDSKDMRCYTTCVAQMTGTVRSIGNEMSRLKALPITLALSLSLPMQITKKKEINFDKVLAQLDTMLPPDLKEPAIEAVNACRTVRK